MSASPFVNPLADLSPFFQKQYVKGHSSDVFVAYGRLLAEILLVLPCQVSQPLWWGVRTGNSKGDHRFLTAYWLVTTHVITA